MTDNRLLSHDRSAAHPSEWVRQAGTVFAEFGERSQDSGNVSYGVRVGDERYFVKTPGDPYDPKPYSSHPERVAALRNAVAVARSCEHPALARLRNVVETPTGPALVYDWADGELVGVPRDRRDDPGSSFQRFRALPHSRILECLDTLYDLHRDLEASGWVAVDFYDGSLLYDFRSHRLTVVDIDLYQRGPFRNHMGRMFGSSRFMAPEEFERGAIIDQRTTVYVMGRAALVLLSDGSPDPDAFRGSPQLFEVVRTACAEDPSRRFGSVEELHAAWRSRR